MWLGEGYLFRALDRAGRLIVANALGIAVRLTALWLSPLLVDAQVSAIMRVAMTNAALTSLPVLPALLPGDGISGKPNSYTRFRGTNEILSVRSVVPIFRILPLPSLKL